MSKNNINFKDVISAIKAAEAKKIPNESILHNIKTEFLTKYNIRVFRENIEIPKIIHDSDIPDNADIETDETAPTRTNIRLILASDRASRNNKISLTSEANGIVINFDNWELLSFPPPALSFNMRKHEIIDNLSLANYSIIDVDYGTIVTLYWFNKWIFSSSNSYEIDDKIWVGRKTFRTVIDEVFKTYDFDVNTLDKNWCYSFGFHHSEYHPFDGAGQAPMRAWFIRAVNVNNFNKTGEMVISTDAAIINNKIPIQGLSDINKKAILQPEKTYDKIIDNCNNALSSYNNNRQKTPCYGYILKSNKPDIADVLIESDLLRWIRKLICQRPPIEIPCERRFIWWMVNATFSEDEKPIFRALFPFTDEDGKKIDKVIRELSSKVVEISTRSNYEFKNTRTDRVVKFIIDKMASAKVMVNRKPISISVVQDFIMVRNFASILITLL